MRASKADEMEMRHAEQEIESEINSRKCSRNTIYRNVLTLLPGLNDATLSSGFSSQNVTHKYVRSAVFVHSLHTTCGH